MNTLVWQLRQWGRLLGRTGVVGVALLVLAAILQLVDVVPLKARIEAGEARIAELEVASARRKTVDAAAIAPVIKAALPAAATPTITVAGERVRELVKLAAAHDIVLPRGQYTPAPISGTTLVRWQILLPVDAPYPALRRFVADSLAAMPTLALEDFRVKRENIGSDTVEADLRFNLYLQEAAP